MKRKNSFGCWICNDVAEAVTLAGGCRARLCLDHHNEWHKFVRGHELMIERNNLRIEGYIAAERLDEGQIKSVMGEIRKNEVLLYALGETWVDAAIIHQALKDKDKEEV